MRQLRDGTREQVLIVPDILDLIQFALNTVSNVAFTTRLTWR